MGPGHRRADARAVRREQATPDHGIVVLSDGSLLVSLIRERDRDDGSISSPGSQRTGRSCSRRRTSRRGAGGRAASRARCCLRRRRDRDGDRRGGHARCAHRKAKRAAVRELFPRSRSCDRKIAAVAWPAGGPVACMAADLIFDARARNADHATRCSRHDVRRSPRGDVRGGVLARWPARDGGSKDARIVVRDGLVPRCELAGVTGDVSAFATSHDGAVIAAATADAIVVWRSAGCPRATPAH